MNERRYNVVFSGKIGQGQQIEDVKQRVAALYKVPLSTCHKMFTGKVIRLKKQVNAVTAKKYKKAFEKTGAICRIEEIKPQPQRQSPQKPSLPHFGQAPPHISEKQHPESMNWSIRLAQMCRSHMDRLPTWQIVIVFFLLGECAIVAAGLLLKVGRLFLPHSSFLPWLVTSVVTSVLLFGMGWLSRSLPEKSHVTNIRNIFLIIGIGDALFFALGPLLLASLPDMTARYVLSLAFWSFLVGLSVILCWKRTIDPFRLLSLIMLGSVFFRFAVGRILGVIFVPGIVFAFCAFAVSGSQES